MKNGDERPVTDPLKEAAACVAVLDTPEHAAAYLTKLKTRAGLQWLLVDSGRYMAEIVNSASFSINMFLFDFTSNLTDRIKPYLRVCESPQYQDVPVLFLATKETVKQLQQIIDRPNDRFIAMPAEPDQILTLMGSMLRRAKRVDMQLKCWVRLDERLIEGVTNDISSTGMQIIISDPILYPQLIIDVFLPDGERYVRFEGRVRRKEKVDGRYTLGVQLTQYVEGPIEIFSDVVGMDYSELPGVAEANDWVGN